MRSICIALFALLAACVQQSGPPRVRVENGVVEGVERAGVRAFLSVPYAAAPIGALRWRAPQPPANWNGVRDGTAFGPSCMQNQSETGWGPWTAEFSPQGAVSEDCLTLSVWAPAMRSGEALPVMLWIPGGGFTDGGEATPVYDGAALARRGIVVVSINYRVAGFGLFAHPELETEPDGGSGNYALRDTLAALQWVHDNAAGFGGDPDRVTIAGQSAGALLAYVLLDSPQAAGLFAGAIMQSFPPASHVLSQRVTIEQAGAGMAQTLHASTLEQLRAAPAEAVLAASGNDFDLFVDGALITDPRGANLGYLNDVPILAGITADEASFLPNDLASHREAAATYGPRYLTLYPANSDEAAREAAVRADRERSLVAMQRWAAARARASQAPLYLYLWDHPLPGPDAARYAAFHSSELPYMFGSFAAAPQRPFTDTDRAISERMLDYWANFVKTGDPNGAELPAWAPGVFMELGDRFAPLLPVSEEARTLFYAHFDSTGEFQF